MEAKKIELIEKMEKKGMTTQQVAEAMSFNPEVLSLYLLKDAWPVPTRILAQVASVVGD